MPPSLTVVLTATPGSGALTEALAGAALAGADAIARTQRWLSPGDAWEATFDGASSSHVLRRRVEQAIGDAPVDVNVIAGDGPRRKAMLCADMESTMIRQELIDEMASLIGCHAEISAITAAAMRGEIDFEASLTQRVALFAGLDVGRLDGILARATLMPGAEALVATLRAHGSRCVLVSGGFTIFAERIAERLGFDDVVANVLEIENGRLTGRVRSPVVDAKGKAAALVRLARENGLDASDTIAVGDGSNDVAMLSAAGLGVAFRAKPMVARHARDLDHGAVVTHGDLTALLHLQGLSPVSPRYLV